MDKYSAGVITFEKIAEILKKNHNLAEGDIIGQFGFNSQLVEDLSNYFKTLQNVDFNEKEFKKICLK